jgi:uncharacterized phage-associated protein
MFLSYRREKLLNAIVYFVRNTKYCNTLKLFKLLNFLDFEHYRQTGKSVTGLRYKAWRKGPVPDQLWVEIKTAAPELTGVVEIVEHKGENKDDLTRRDFKPKARFDDKYFSKREMQIMERLAFFFKELRAEDMSKFSHGKKMPWEKVYRGEGAPPETIPYELAFESAKIIDHMPSIDSREQKYRAEALKEVRANTK